MSEENKIFHTVKQFPKFVQIVIYVGFSAVILILVTSVVRTSGIIPNYSVENYFLKSTDTLMDGNKLKIKKMQDSAYIEYQNNLLRIDSQRIKLGLFPISNPKNIQNGNLIDDGPISNLLYYAICIAIVIVAFNFRKNSNHLYLILNFCFVLLLIGLFALLKGIMTPSHFVGFGFDFRTASVGAIICVAATSVVFVLVGMFRKKKIEPNESYVD